MSYSSSSPCDVIITIITTGDKWILKMCTLVQALRLCRGRTAHRGSRDIALPFLDHGTRRGWGVSVTPWPLFTPRKDPVPIVQEAELVPGPVWTGAVNLASPVFDPRTVQPVASRYIDCATRPTGDKWETHIILVPCNLTLALFPNDGIVLPYCHHSMLF
jgi:hypothetical protein